MKNALSIISSIPTFSYRKVTGLCVMMRDAYLRQEVKGHLRVDVPLFRLKKNEVKKVISGHMYTVKPHLSSQI